MVEGGVPIVRSGGCGRVSNDAPPYPAQRGPGGPGGGGGGLTGSPSLKVCDGSGARWRGAWEGLRIEPTSGFTLRTATHGTQ